MKEVWRMHVEISARNKTSTCAVADAFENPLFSVGASNPGFGSHYQGGPASAEFSKVRLPAGTPSVRQKLRPFTNTAEVDAHHNTPSIGSQAQPAHKSHTVQWAERTEHCAGNCREKEIENPVFIPFAWGYTDGAVCGGYSVMARP